MYVALNFKKPSGHVKSPMTQLENGQTSKCFIKLLFGNFMLPFFMQLSELLNCPI